jgi:hypothetical protein
MTTKHFKNEKKKPDVIGVNNLIQLIVYLFSYLGSQLLRCSSFHRSWTELFHVLSYYAAWGGL